MEAFLNLPKFLNYSRSGKLGHPASLTLNITLLFARYGKRIDLKENCFNAGVYGVNLELWRQKKIHDEVLYWMDQVWEGLVSADAM